MLEVHFDGLSGFSLAQLLLGLPMANQSIELV